MSRHSSPLDNHLEQISAWIGQQWTNAQIVEGLRKLGVVTSEGSVRRAKRRIGIAPKSLDGPSFKKSGDTAVIESGKSVTIPTPEELIRSSDLDPEEWTYDDPDIGWWGSPDNRFYSMKLRLKRKKPLEVVLPARVDGVYIAPKRVVDRRKVQGVLIYGDQQCKFIDWDIFGGMLALTKEFRPSLIIDPGDGRDFPSVSHHRTWPEWRAAAQECIDTKYTVDREMRRANEDARIVQLLGNHDIRLSSYMLEKAPAAYGLTPGCAEDEERMLEAYSIQNLGRLDELRVELAANEKEAYDQARFMISDYLGVEHGNKTGKDPAIKAQHRRTFSVTMGHTHGQSINHVVDYDHNNEAHVHLAIETGTGAVRDRGIGFANNPNWVGGGVWISLHQDGGFHAELITYKNGYLHFRDKRY